MDGSVTTTKTKARKVKTPPGYKDEAEFLEEARKRFAEGQDFDRINRDAAQDDLAFFAGEQWDDTVKANRTAIGRPSLTINRLPQFVAQVIGDIRINKPAIKVRPAEDGDKDVAKTRQGLIRAIEHDCNAQGVYANAAQSQIACGIGNFAVRLEYASDSAFEQNIAVRPIPDPFAVVWDPMSVDPTGKDARFCFVVDEMPRAAFEAAFPGQTPSDLSAEAHADGWSTVDTVRVTEYWVMKERPTLVALLEDGKTVVVEEAGDVPAPDDAALQAGGPAYVDLDGNPVRPVLNRRGEPTVRKSKIRSACRYLISGTAILEGPYELPISRLPVFRVEAWVVNVKSRRVRFGLVRFAKDPQRLLNYWRSVSAELLALAPKAQWTAEARSVEGREEDYRNSHRNGDPLLIHNDGTPAPARVDPPAFPAAILQEASLNAQDMKDVTGLHDASLGAQGNETSGRAIMARDRQGDVATFIYPDNLKDAIAEGGRVINELIGIVYDTTRTIRILGEDESATLVKINDPADKATDITGGRYDVIVETGPSYSTKRVEAAESMMAFVQAVPLAGQVAGDLIAKAQDWHMAEQIGDRLKKTLPPQLQDEEDDGKPPPVDPAQEAAAQMAAQMGALELRKAEAEAKKAEADAVKAEAEAAQAEMEAERQSYGVDALRKVQTDIAARFAEHAKAPPALPGSDQAAQAEAAQMKIEGQAAPSGAAPTPSGGNEAFGQEGSPPLETPAMGESPPAL